MLCLVGFSVDQVRLGYPGGCSVKYISDFSNISTIRQGISTYRQSKTKEILHIPRNILYEKRTTGSKAKILKNPIGESTKLLAKPLRKTNIKTRLNFLTNPPSRTPTTKKTPPPPKTLPQTRKSFPIKKGNLLLFPSMRVQCKIARKDEKYLQDYCVRVA
ncbi:hypothetical protein AT258_20030 [Bacillus wiedmannii]|nr:hypothetical protein AT258_20030 [Bacillus wiedmannii]